MLALIGEASGGRSPTGRSMSLPSLTGMPSKLRMRKLFTDHQCSCMNLTLGSVSGFLPTISKFYFESPAHEEQILTLNYSQGSRIHRSTSSALHRSSVRCRPCCHGHARRHLRQAANSRVRRQPSRVPFCRSNTILPSDSIPAASVFIIGIVGWVLLLTISPVKASASHLHIRYFGCICIVTAGYCAIPIIMR
jgi:hypothetical protein